LLQFSDNFVQLVVTILKHAARSVQQNMHLMMFAHAYCSERILRIAERFSKQAI